MLYGGTLLVIVCIGSLECVCGGEWCYHSWCEYGCCGDECCQYSLLIILGAVFGGLLFLVTVVVCIVCIYCMCRSNRQSQATRHTVIQPASSNTVYVHNISYAHPPPSYNQFGAFPSTPTSRPPAYNDPAYPPGTVNSGFSGDHPPAYEV